jgi:hypothetical protein
MRSLTMILGACVSMLATTTESAPHLNIGGRSFAELNVEVTGVSVRPRGTNMLVPVTVASATSTINLLDVTNTGSLVSMANIPDGVYQSLVLSVVDTTVHLVEADVGLSVPVSIADTPGSITIDFAPPMRIEPGYESVLVIPWQVAENTSGGGYVLTSVARATSEEHGRSGSFRTISARVVEVFPVLGEIRVRLQRNDVVAYRVSTAGVTLVDQHGTAVSPATLSPDDRLLIAGQFDSAADVVAESITVLR